MKEFDADVIREYARAARLPTALAEKDYVLSVVLAFISKLPEAETLVFKGGTALRKAYFAGYRLSADLDFTVVGGSRAALKKSLEALEGKEVEGVSFLKLSDKTLQGMNSLNVALQYESRIGTTQGKRHVDSVKMDFNFDSKVFLKPEKQRIISPREFALEDFEINAMQIEEIISEKIHAIYKRPKPRDLYDLHYLLKKGYKINTGLANKKLESIGEKLGIEGFTRHVEKLRAKWETDMKGLLHSVPDFDAVASETLQTMQNLG